MENGTATEPEKTATAGDTAAPAATPAPLTAEEKALQERRAAHDRSFAGELAARVQQRQERVQAIKKELQTLQQDHAAGKPTATVAARDALQQSLSEAERELGSAQRALSRAEAQNKPATVATAAPPKQ
jgi:chromosome segregation ATPase